MESGNVVEICVVKYDVGDVLIFLEIDVLHRVVKGIQDLSVKIGRDTHALAKGSSAEITQSVVGQGERTPLYFTSSIEDHSSFCDDHEVVIILLDIVVSSVDCIEIPFIVELGLTKRSQCIETRYRVTVTR